MCLYLNWVFQGFASFHTKAKNSPIGPEQEENEDMGPFSEDAAHLFFSVQPPLSDPAQLVLKVGVTRKQFGRYSSGVVLAFDNSSLFFLDFRQVLTISMWNQEQGCKLCKISNCEPRDLDKQFTCACRVLSSNVTLNFQHVALNIYSTAQPDETLEAASHNVSENIGVVEHLHKVLQEQRVQSILGLREEDPIMHTLGDTAEPSSFINTSNTLLQQFLTRLDCMSECSVRAVEVCSADVPWMAQLLRTMGQHAADHKGRSTQLKTLQHQLHSCLQAIEEEEQTHVAILWGPNSMHQQEARERAVMAMQQTMEQRKKLEEALLQVELMNAAIA